VLTALQALDSTSVVVGGKFPWDQAAEKRNEIVLSQPQTARYFLS
jgi:hypothetical protein